MSTEPAFSVVNVKIARSTLRACVEEIERVEAAGWRLMRIIDYFRRKETSTPIDVWIVELRVEFGKDVWL